VEKGQLKFKGESHCDTWAVSRKRMGKHVATEMLILGNQLITEQFSMDTETESCKHLENQTIAWELTHGFRGNAFMKSSNGTLGGGGLCSVLRRS
jgi:hypothetical protein